jgi:hypothetical protein
MSADVCKCGCTCVEFVTSARQCIGRADLDVAADRAIGYRSTAHHPFTSSRVA